MKISKSKLKKLIENFLYEDEAEEIPADEEPADEEPAEGEAEESGSEEEPEDSTGGEEKPTDDSGESEDVKKKQEDNIAKMSGIEGLNAYIKLLASNSATGIADKINMPKNVKEELLKFAPRSISISDSESHDMKSFETKFGMLVSTIVNKMKMQ